MLCYYLLLLQVLLLLSIIPLLPIVTVIMGLLLPIIARSIIDNNGFIIQGLPTIDRSNLSMEFQVLELEFTLTNQN